MSDEIVHFGVKGMKWGKRKSQTTKSSKTSSEKMDPKLKKDLIKSAVLLGTASTIKLGANYLAKHPEIIDRTVNTIKGTKSIDVGYQVVSMTLKNGVWR